VIRPINARWAHGATMVCGGHWSTDSMRCHLACHMKRKTRLGWKDAILWLKVGCANPECTVKAQVSGEGCLGAFRACPRLPYNKGRPPIPRRTGRGPMRSSQGVARTTAGSVARPMGTACSAPDHGAVTRQRHGPIYRHAMRSRAATRLSHVQGNVAIKGILLLYRWGEAGVSPTGPVPCGWERDVEAQLCVYPPPIKCLAAFASP